MSSPSTRFSSHIWYHFTKFEKNAKCRYCQKTLSISGSSSNLKRHLKTKHPTVPIERLKSPSINEISDCRGNLNLQSQTCPTTSILAEHAQPRIEVKETQSDSCPEIESSFSFTTASSSSSAILQQSMSKFINVIKPIPLNKSRAIDTQLLKMICKEYHPFSLVEDKEFQKFVEMLSPNYKLPSRKTLSNSLLPAVYNELFDKIKFHLGMAKAMCLTSDGWTSLNNISFYALTAHFIDKNSQLISYLLECSEFEEKHTAQNISQWINLVLRKFDIHYKITAIITDNAANMKAAATNLNIRHFPCFAHSLNLIVQHAINMSMQNIVDEVKHVVMYFKKSSFALAKLTTMQENLNKDKLKLKQNVVTRWNSTFDMLERFLLNKDPIISSIAILGMKTFKLVDRDWEVIQHAIDILRVFDEVTKTVSLSKMVVLVKLMARKLKLYMEKNRNCCEEINALLDNLLNGLIERFGGVCNNELITQAAVLDPRFKKQAFIEDNAKFRDIYNSILQQMKTLIVQQSTPQIEAVTSITPTPTTSSGSSIWEDFNQGISNLQGRHDPGSAAIVELDKYLSESYLTRNADPLAWWESRKSIYPTLYQIMLKRLCIPATSVPCERIFSKAGQICTEKRNRLSTCKISNILFLNHNMQ